MALNSMGLGVTFTARDAMSGTLFRLQRAFSGLEMSSRAAVAAVGAGFASMAAGVAAVTAGVAGLETGMNLAAKTGEFEASITRVGLVAGNTAPEALRQMSDAALNAAQETGFATADVTKGLEEIAALGYSATESLAMLPNALNLAASGGISVADAAEAMGSAMKVFSIEASPENMKQVASQLVGIANTTGLQASDLRIALGTVGRGASAAKQQLDEVLIMMGLVKNTGVDATVAASSVSSALLFMAENAAKFRKLGIEVEDANGKVRKMGDIFLELNEVLKQNPHMTENISVVKDLLQRFGITAYQGVVEQLGSGHIKNDATGEAFKDAEALNYLRGEMAKFAAQDLAGKNAEMMLAQYTGLTKRLGVIWETLLIELGQGFKDIFITPLEWLVEGLQNFERFLRGLPKEVKIVAAALFLGASAMTIAAGAALLLAGAIAIVGAVIILAGPPLLAWFGTVLAPALPLAAAAAVLTGALLAFGGALGFVFTKNLGGATDSLMAFFNKWKLIISAVVAFLTEGELTGALNDEFLAADSETQETIKRFYLFFEKLRAGFMAMVETISAELDTRAVPALERLWKAFLQVTDALGFTDGAYLKMSEAMDKGDFETQGRLIGDSLVQAFLGVANAMIIALKATFALIEGFKFLWKFKDLFVAVASGNVIDVAKAMYGLTIGSDEDNKAKADMETRLNQIQFDLEAYRMRHGQVDVALPAATAASMEGEQRERAYEALFQKFSKQHDTSKGYYTLENKLYLDGKLVYESMKNHAKDENDSSFAADGRNYSEELGG